MIYLNEDVAQAQLAMCLSIFLPAGLEMNKVAGEWRMQWRHLKSRRPRRKSDLILPFLGILPCQNVLRHRGQYNRYRLCFEQEQQMVARYQCCQRQADLCSSRSQNI